MQPVVVGLPTATAVGYFLMQETVAVAVMLTHDQRKLGCQVLVDDQLDVGRLIQQHSAAPRAAYQLALVLHQHGDHVPTRSGSIMRRRM